MTQLIAETVVGASREFEICMGVLLLACMDAS